jgi:4-hydroxyphenylacetate 3-monooxygenase
MAGMDPSSYPVAAETRPAALILRYRAIGAARENPPVRREKSVNRASVFVNAGPRRGQRKTPIRCCAAACSGVPRRAGNSNKIRPHPGRRSMIRTGAEYRQSIRDGRAVFIDGKRVEDVTAHAMFKPLVDIRARIYDMQHEAATQATMTYAAGGERFAIGHKLPYEQADWHAKRKAVDAVMWDIGGVVTRVGDETVGEMWSLWDGAEILKEIDGRFVRNIEAHIRRAEELDPFHVSANTDPKGDRSKRPQEQDPDFLVRIVKETDAGIVIRGAKYETASAYANQAFLKPTIANWGDAKLSDYAVGCIVRMEAPGVKHICRTGFAGRRDARDYPLANRFDEVDTLMVLDNVLIPWEDVLFYRHTRAATFIRATVHRYSAFAYVQRTLTTADMLIGAALWNARQTGLEKQQAVQEKLAEIAVWREGINAHLTAAIAMAERSESGLLMPNQSLLMTGRVHAISGLPRMMHLARELCGGQICVTPDVAAFEAPETKPWLDKFYSINEQWVAEDRRKLLAFARDLINSDYAGHRLTFQLFAQAPPFAHLAAVYRNFDWNEPLRFAQKCAGLSDAVWGAERPKAAE